MATLAEIKEARLKKLENFKKAGNLPYPVKVKRSHTVADLLLKFSALAKAGKEITAAGRIKSLRGHGGSTFFDIEDGTGSMQAYLKLDRLGEVSYNFFLNHFDIGDFVQVRGVLFTTKRGEKTIEVADYKILAKSLLPLPDKWHGLQDVEERYRKRYLDLIFSKEVRGKFEKRSQLLSALRQFLDKEGFMEVETPILQTLYGGAEALPFTTHLNAFNMKMYLRIAPELYLKRLIVGGFEKVYEIGRVFRNEGVDRSHNPDFTMLEFYWAYADYKDLMRLTEKLLTHAVKTLFKKLKVTYESKGIDFKAPWPRIEYSDLLKTYAKIDIESSNKESLQKKAEELGVSVKPGSSKFQIVDAIYKKYCLPKLWNPTFIIHHPAGAKPLAKPLDEDPSKLSSFQLIVAGWEIINAYSELNDPIAQAQVFKDQEKLFKEGMEDAQRMDTDYIEALEYAMPPTAGFGLGIDRFAALLTDSHSLREVILFPTMKPKS